jgi:hypothetical protein
VILWNISSWRLNLFDYDFIVICYEKINIEIYFKNKKMGSEFSWILLKDLGK